MPRCRSGADPVGRRQPNGNAVGEVERGDVEVGRRECERRTVRSHSLGLKCRRVRGDAANRAEHRGQDRQRDRSPRRRAGPPRTATPATDATFDAAPVRFGVDRRERRRAALADDLPRRLLRLPEQRRGRAAQPYAAIVRERRELARFVAGERDGLLRVHVLARLERGARHGSMRRRGVRLTTASTEPSASSSSSERYSLPPCARRAPRRGRARCRSRPRARAASSAIRAGVALRDDSRADQRDPHASHSLELARASRGDRRSGRTSPARARC